MTMKISASITSVEATFMTMEISIMKHPYCIADAFRIKHRFMQLTTFECFGNFVVLKQNIFHLKNFNAYFRNIVEVANFQLVSTFLYLFSGLLVQSKVYLESSQKSAMELFCKIS